jgi:hypothetical protein
MTDLKDYFRMLDAFVRENPREDDWLEKVIEEDRAECFLRDAFEERRYRRYTELEGEAEREGINPDQLFDAMKVVNIHARRRDGEWIWKRGRWNDGFDREDPIGVLAKR